MHDEDGKRRDEQIEKLWAAMDDVRKDTAKLWSALRELRVVLIGVDGINGMNSRVKSIEASLKGLEVALENYIKCVEKQIQNAPHSCPVNERLLSHITEGKEAMNNKRADWQKWVQTIAMICTFLMMLATFVKFIL